MLVQVEFYLKAIVFDLDETLIHSGIDFEKMKSEIIELLQKAGVSHDLINDHMLNFQIMEATREDLKSKGFAKEKIECVFAEASTIMNRIELESLSTSSLIDGVPETLKKLRRKGFKIGIMTNSCHKYAETIVAQFGLDRYIDAISARDDVTKPKPYPEHAHHILKLLGARAEETILVGDHWLDAECARKSGLMFILARKGGRSLAWPVGVGCRNVEKISDIINTVAELTKKRRAPEREVGAL